MRSQQKIIILFSVVVLLFVVVGRFDDWCESEARENHQSFIQTLLK